MLIYIHVPFCKRKCNYCAFHSEPVQSLELEDSPILMPKDSWANINVFSKWDIKKNKWLNALMQEIDEKFRHLGKVPVKTIFFGGGTPSLLDSKDIDIILRKIRKNFKVDIKAEITLESNPESLDDRKKVKEFFEVGINRLSIGVQAFDDTMLQKLGRIHTVSDAINAIYNGRYAGFKNINVDMMWGLPNQRIGQWISQLTEVIKLKPDHISAYGLTIEPGTRLAFALEEKEFDLPNENELATMYMRGSEILEENGYLQYEISNYSRMGFHCRHNLGYWEGVEYLGLGPSATSTIAGVRWTNPSDLDTWIAQIQSPVLAPDPEVLTLQDRVIELIMLRLRTTRGMRVKAFSDLTGRDFLKDNKQLIHALHKNGLIRILNGYVKLTRNGFMVSNSILSHLFENTKRQMALGEDKEYLAKLNKHKINKVLSEK